MCYCTIFIYFCVNPHNENVHKHTKEKMKIWDIEQEDTVSGEASEEDTVMGEGTVEVMDMERDTLLIRVTLPNA
jgi:hypothetical protein